MSAALEGLAQSIAAEPGLHWKIWTENAAERIAGGIYLFDTRANAAAYLAMHSARLAGFGITDIRARLLDVKEALTRIDRGPLA